MGFRAHHLDARIKFWFHRWTLIQQQYLCQWLTSSTNKGRFCNNSKLDTLIAKRLYVENKAKLFQLEIVNKQYWEEVFWVSSWASFGLFSTDNRFKISVSISLLLQNLPLLVERVSLCSLLLIALKLVYQFRYCCKTCPCFFYQLFIMLLMMGGS